MQERLRKLGSILRDSLELRSWSVFQELCNWIKSHSTSAGLCVEEINNKMLFSFSLLLLYHLSKPEVADYPVDCISSSYSLRLVTSLPSSAFSAVANRNLIGTAPSQVHRNKRTTVSAICQPQVDEAMFYPTTDEPEHRF